MNALRILRALLPSNRRGDEMRRRRAERLERAEAELYGGAIDMTPKMWQAVHEGHGYAASLPDDVQRNLPPQLRCRPRWMNERPTGDALPKLRYPLNWN